MSAMDFLLYPNKHFSSTSLTFSFDHSYALWDSFDSSDTIEFFDYASRSSIPSGTQQNYFSHAFALWDSYSTFSFSETSGKGDINAYKADELFDNAFALTTHFDTAISTGPSASYTDQDYERSEMVFADDFSVSAIGTYNFETILHEIGHALGLDHPNGDGGDSNYNTTMTVMSYNVVSGHYAITPMAYDIEALRQQYGDFDHNEGDTIFDADELNIEGEFTAQTIVDTEGEADEINLSGVAGKHIIDLRPALNSSFQWLDYKTVVAGKEWIFISKDTHIENATGGSGNDIIYGNAGDNVLSGGNGNDFINGNGGSDEIFGGNGDDFFMGGGGTRIGGNGFDNYYVERGTSMDIADDGGNIILSNEFLGDGPLLIGPDGADVLIVATEIDYHPTKDILSFIRIQNTTIEQFEDRWSLSFSGIVRYWDIEAQNDWDFSESLFDTEVQLLGGGDTFQGSPYIDDVDGGEGDDTLNGAAGADLLFGGVGNDTLIGGDGNDTLDGGDGFDIGDYSAASSGVVVNLGSGSSSGGAGSDTLSGIEGLNGSAYGDTLTGDANANVLYGGEGGDTIYGGDGDDVLEGGLGNDTLDGGDGADTADYAQAASGVTVLLSYLVAYGGAGTDTLTGIENVVGSTFTDFIFGDDSDNAIIGGLGNDTIAGEGGNDILYADNGSDSLSGGAGGDRFVIEAGAQDVTIVDFFDGGDRLDLTAFTGIRSIYDLALTNDGDDLLVTAVDDDIEFSVKLNFWNADSAQFLNFRFFGAPDAYDDYLTIGSGALAVLDVLANDEETSNDALNIHAVSPANFGAAAVSSDNTVDYVPRAGFTGVDTFSYTVINDDYFEDTASVTVTVLNPGGQYIIGLDSDEIITGGSGDDFLFAFGGGNSSMNGAGGNDYLVSLSGDGSIDGGSGSDYFELNGSNGNGVVVNLATGQGYELGYSAGVTTISNFENLMGSYTDDVLTGDSNNNVLSGNTGSDTIDGGAGTDTVDYRNFLTYNSAAITANLATGTAYDATDASTDTLVSIENVIGGVSGDTIVGNSAANVLEGWEGNDILEGGAGNDVLSGGDGVDTARYSAAASAVTVNLTTGTATGGDGSDTLTAIENVIASAYADTLTGDAGTNTLEGLAGNDSIYGNAGADLIYGGDGDDFVSAGKGSDTAYGGSGNDRLFGDVGGEPDAGDDTLYGENGDDELYGRDGNDTLEGGAGVDLLEGGAGNDILRGGDGVDTLKGQEGADTLYGDAGNDTLFGDDGFTVGGDDTLYGGAGADTLDGRIGNDTIYGGDDNDSIKGSLGDDILYGDAGADILYGDDDLTTVGHDTLYGGDGNDTLYGRAGNDMLNGNAGVDSVQGQDGNDTLWAGEGADNLYGGTGTNTFSLYNKAGNDNDLALVHDWATGTNNVIDIADLLTDYEAGVDTLSDFVNVTVATHTTISVDRDGTGSTYGWDDVLRLQNIGTFETNENTLVTNGTLLVA